MQYVFAFIVLGIVYTLVSNTTPPSTTGDEDVNSNEIEVQNNVISEFNSYLEAFIPTGETLVTVLISVATSLIVLFIINFLF